MILKYALETLILESDRSVFSDETALGKSDLSKAVSREIMDL